MALPSLLPGQSSVGGVSVKANRWEKNKEVMTAWGNVEVIYKDIKLLADYIYLNTESKEIYATGDVSIHMLYETHFVESIRFNLETGEGLFEKVKGMVQPAIYFEAESLERKKDNLYNLERGSLTSCTQPTPRWKFSFSRANFKKDKYFEMWNAVFRIKKVPVFYLPYMRYPVDQERSTGFLMPQVGYNGVKGLFYSQGFYWAMLRNMDATLNFDMYTTRGMGGGLEYRYLFSDAMGGELKLYYFDFKENPERNDPENAYLIRFNHNQPLFFGFNLVADVDIQSSYQFLREFDNNFRRAVISNRSSQVYLQRSWSYFNMNVRVSRFETYFTELDDSIIKNNLPQFSFSSSKIKIVDPVYFSFSSNFQSWEYGWERDYETNTQTHSQSFSITPQLTVPFTAIPWLEFTSSLSGNLKYYFNSYLPNSRKIVAEPFMVNTFSVNFNLIGPVINRIFFDSEGSPKFKHIIEPTFSYRYDTPVSVSDRIITTWIYYRNHYMSYGITNHLLMKQEAGTRTILTVGLNQVFYLEPEESPLRIYEVNGRVPRYSDANLYLRFYPARRYSVDFSASYNPYHKTFSRLRLGASMGSLNDPFFLNVSWYKSINPYIEDNIWARHQINVYAGFKIPALSLEAQGEIDFNIHKGEMLYTAASLIYHYQCLDFIADVKIFYFREKPEFQFMFSFGLGNIGKTTNFLGGMGF
ncbi:LPS-assembly protein LptD [Acidobacteriota bacterium]